MCIDNEIQAFAHCKHCLENLPIGMSPADWSDLECGFTNRGFQVWCKRCKLTVIYFECEEESISMGLTNITETETLQ